MKEKFKTWFRETIWDHEQVLLIRQKYAELDAQTQSYILIGAFSSFVIILFFTFVGFWVKASSLKSDISSLEDSIRMVQSSSAKIEEFKAQSRNQNADSMLKDFDTTAPIATFVERASQKSLIAKASVEIGETKGNSVDVKLNKISLRQLVRMLYMVEQSHSGGVVEKLNIDTKDDPEGYLWATLTVKKELKKGTL